LPVVRRRFWLVVRWPLEGRPDLKCGCWPPILASPRARSRDLRRRRGPTSLPNTTTVFEIYCLGFDPHPSEPRHPRGAFSVIDQRDFAEQRYRQIRELRSLANRETENTLENRETTAHGSRSPCSARYSHYTRDRTANGASSMSRFVDRNGLRWSSFEFTTYQNSCIKNTASYPKPERLTIRQASKILVKSHLGVLMWSREARQPLRK
jgi:hypothetical protein